MSTDTYNVWAIILAGLTLAALLFYTYYTRQLLLTSQATTRSTQRELEIMQAQLDTTQSAQKLQMERELRAARPVFVWKNGSLEVPPGTRRMEFQNQGAPIAILETRALHCQFTLSPQNFIPKDGTGFFNVGHYAPVGVIYIGIRYVTGMNEVQALVFRIEEKSVSPRVERAFNFDGMEIMPPPPQPVDFIL